MTAYFGAGGVDELCSQLDTHVRFSKRFWPVNIALLLRYAVRAKGKARFQRSAFHTIPWRLPCPCDICLHERLHILLASPTKGVAYCTAAERSRSFLDALDGGCETATLVAQIDAPHWRHLSFGGEATKLRCASSFSTLGM